VTSSAGTTVAKTTNWSASAYACRRARPITGGSSMAMASSTAASASQCRWRSQRSPDAGWLGTGHLPVVSRTAARRLSGGTWHTGEHRTLFLPAASWLAGQGRRL